MTQCGLLFFFFSSRRRHTRSDRDWSSDVCSSDLGWRGTRPPYFRAILKAPPRAGLFFIGSKRPVVAVGLFLFGMNMFNGTAHADGQKAAAFFARRRGLCCGLKEIPHMAAILTPSRLIVVAGLALGLAACNKLGSGQDEMSWARAALERNDRIEVVAADQQTSTFTVRLKDTGELRTLRIDQIVGGPPLPTGREAKAGAQAAAAPAPTSAEPAPPPAQTATPSADAQSSPTDAHANTVAASGEPAAPPPQPSVAEPA